MSIDITTIGVGVDTAKLKAGSRELDNFGKSADNASRKADNLTDKNEKTGKAFSVMASGAKLAAVGLSAAGIGALAMGSAVLDSFIKLEKLNNSLKFSTGSSKAAAQEIEYLKTTTNRLGLEFVSTAEAFSKFNAATKGTALEGQKTRDVFESIAKASTVLGLTADETKGALNALQQMMSKGTVSAEELRGQLGERIPGAFNIAAKAMGITTQELGKMLEQGELVSADFLPKFAAELTKTLGDSPESAAGSAQAQINKLTNAWTEFKTAIAESGVVTIVLKVAEGTTDALKWFNHFVFNKGELADLNKVNADRDNLANLEQRVNTRKPQSSPIETSGMRQSRLNTFNTAQAKDKAEIRRLRISLGLEDGSSTKPATGNILDSGIAPNYGINKKPGEGGYDARQNNEKLLHDLAKQNTVASNKAYEEKVKELQREVSEEFEAAEMKAEYKYDLDKKSKEEADKLKEITYKEDLKRIDALQDQANANYKEAQKPFKDAEEEKLRELEKTKDGMNQLFREGFASMINGGTSSWKAFVKQTFTQFKTGVADKIYKLLAEPFVVKILASIAGVSASGAASAGGLVESLTGGGSNSLFGSIKDLSSNIKGGLTGSIEKLGAFFATGNGGLSDSIGGFLGQYAGSIANYAPYAGAFIQAISGDLKGAAFTAAGAAIGSIIPGVGTAIGAVVGGLVGSLFGGKAVPRPKYYADTRVSESGGTLVRGWKNGDGKRSVLNQTNGIFTSAAQSISEISKALGGSIAKEFQVSMTYNQKHNLYGINVGRGSTKGEWDVYGKDGNLQEAVAEAALLAMKKGFIKLPEYLNSVLSRGGSGSVALGALSSIKSLYESLDTLPAVFGSVKYAINSLATATNESVSALKASMDGIATYVDLFYTDQEKLNTLQSQLSKAFNSLGQALPATRDGFRALVDGFDITNDATYGVFSGLISLAPAMNAYFKAMEQQNDVTNEAANAAKALADALDPQMFKTLVDFNRAKGITANYGGAFADSYLRGINTPAANSNFTSVPMTNSVNALNNTTISTSDPNLLNAITVLSQKVDGLIASSDKTALHSKRAADVLVNVSPNGDALQTELAA